jgi:radical SAM superfamily enzyme YgiQ (UPF0313 family)
MNTLLVYPEFPPSYWGFHYGMPLAGKKASLPPLGLITLAAQLPEDWPVKLVDLNVRELQDEELRWADVVFVGGMHVQGPSIHDVLARARAVGVRTVVGGPAPTTAPSEFADADLIFQGEVEGRIDELVEALRAPVGEVALLAGPTDGFRPPVCDLPPPRFELLDMDAYTSMAVQYSRGCPFNCEFCDIIEIYGRVPRVKRAEQMIGEFARLYELGFRGSVFVVDDNFIGNKATVKQLLPQLAEWQRAKGMPFELYTEASVNLAWDDELVEGMRQAGFSAVFLGIETPSKDALLEAGKKQNLKMGADEAVRRITSAGIEVYAGFIVGFDSDGADAFQMQYDFISQLPLPLAMLGLLTALPGTALWRRMKREGRLRTISSGSNFGRPNFEPMMDERTLIEGYAKLLADLYTPEAYYRRCMEYVESAPPLPGGKRPTLRQVPVLLRTLYAIGLKSPYRRLFWRLLGKAVRHAPHHFAWVIGHAVMGEHLIRYTHEDVVPQLTSVVQQVEPRAQQPLAQPAHEAAG